MPAVRAPDTASDAYAAPQTAMPYRAGLKRLLDVALVLLTAPIWLVIIGVAACLVALDGHSPFYTQQRIGMNGRVFRLFKLRSMVHDADATLEAYLEETPEARLEWTSTQKLKNDPRITAIGRFIRKTSIDELPQVLNVLRGEMSIVGPRPIMVNQKALYPGGHYYEMRPGLTGFWQISDRNECRFVDRVRYDNAYYASLTFKTDLVVMWRTIGVVLRGTGY